MATKRPWIFTPTRTWSVDYAKRVIGIGITSAEAKPAAGRQNWLQVSYSELDFTIKTLTQFRARFTEHEFEPTGGRGLYCEVCDARFEDAQHAVHPLDPPPLRHDFAPSESDETRCATCGQAKNAVLHD